MMRALNITVHVQDNQGKTHIYGPGTVPPEWAVEKITNPDVWADGDEDDDVIADPVTPTEYTTPGVSTPPANDPDSGGGQGGDTGQGGDQQPGPDDPPVKPMDEWTVPQLREYAHQAGIDLGSLTRRADILAAVKAATATAPDGDAQA